MRLHEMPTAKKQRTEPLPAVGITCICSLDVDAKVLATRSLIA